MALSHRGICSGEKVHAMRTKRNLYGFRTFATNTKLYVYIPYMYAYFTRTDHRYAYDLYFEKRIHFNRYTYKIDLTPSFIREPACGRLYQFVDACARTMVCA